MKQRIGLLGGSFDPIHSTHIHLANAARTQLHLDSVALIPTGQSWQKEKHYVSPEHRLAMAQIAVREYPGLNVLDLDIKRATPTRTFDTMTELYQTGDEYFWLMGSDQLNNFTTWYRWQDLLRMMQLVVALRADEPIHINDELTYYLAKSNQMIHELHMPSSTTSSTEIRRALKHRQFDTCALPVNVLQYILEHTLYTE